MLVLIIGVMAGLKNQGLDYQTRCNDMHLIFFFIMHTKALSVVSSSILYMASWVFSCLFHKGAVTHLLEQISTLNDRMDDFTSKMEELNSKWSSRRASPRIKQASPSTQNLALETEACIGSAPTNYFISGLENGSLTGSIMPNSSSFTSVNGKEFTLMEEVSLFLGWEFWMCWELKF